MLLHKINFLKRPNFLRTLAFIAVVSKVMSQYLVARFDFRLLDGIWDPEQGRQLIATMTDDQKLQHILFTVSLDVLMPIVFGILFIGVTLNMFPKYGKYLTIPPLIAMPIDYFEGVIQVLVLSNSSDLLAIKAYTSPVKSFGYLFGLIMLFLGLSKLLFHKIKRSQKSRQIDGVINE